MDQNNYIISDEKGTAKVWRKYCQSLYTDDPQNAIHDKFTAEREPNIQKPEVEKAIKNKKSADADQITSEVLKETEDVGVNVVHMIWSNDWRTSTFIPIFKKGTKVLKLLVLKI
ncbi:uncharacterized protein [Diabrotica undecimpunctata]|uniref:uncharacterized protein n=1 Tax=Diabrotica undecimpunctata TaxID=50387 RepID=UPI003B63294A